MSSNRPLSELDTRAVRLLGPLLQQSGLARPADALRDGRWRALGGGRSAATVIHLTPWSGAGRADGSALAVKFGSRPEIARERTHYLAHAQHGLPRKARPELLGHAVDGDAAALCYSWVGAPVARSWTTVLRRGDLSSVSSVLRNLIAPMGAGWYAPAERQSERDLVLHYRRRHFAGAGSLQAAESVLAEWAARYFRLRWDNGVYVRGALAFEAPSRLLERRLPAREWHSCIVHGDANSDNIISTGRPGGWALIDFLKTGRGHVFEDLIALEHSVRINAPAHGARWPSILEDERRIAMGRHAGDGAGIGWAILQIRAAARRRFGAVEPMSNYHLGVLAVGLRLTRATDLSHAAKARITAATLCAAQALS